MARFFHVSYHSYDRYATSCFCQHDVYCANHTQLKIKQTRHSGYGLYHHGFSGYHNNTSLPYSTRLLHATCNPSVCPQPRTGSRKRKIFVPRILSHPASCSRSNQNRYPITHDGLGIAHDAGAGLHCSCCYDKVQPVRRGLSLLGLSCIPYSQMQLFPYWDECGER